MEYKNIRVNGKIYKIFSDDGKYWFLMGKENTVGIYAGLTIDEWTNQEYLDSLTQIKIKEVKLMSDKEMEATARTKLMGVKKIGTLLTPKVVDVEHFELTKTYCVTLQGAEEQVELFTSDNPVRLFQRLALEVREHKTYIDIKENM